MFNVTLDGKRLESPEELQKLRNLIGLYLDLTASDGESAVRVSEAKTEPLAVVPTITPAPVNGALKHNPQPGERKIDYAIQVLEEEGQPLRPEELRQKMIEKGWKPQNTSSDMKRQIRSLEVPLYDDGKVNIERIGGKWSLVKWRNSHSEQTTIMP